MSRLAQLAFILIAIPLGGFAGILAAGETMIFWGALSGAHKTPFWLGDLLVRPLMITGMVVAPVCMWAATNLLSPRFKAAKGRP